MALKLQNFIAWLTIKITKIKYKTNSLTLLNKDKVLSRGLNVTFHWFIFLLDSCNCRAFSRWKHAVSKMSTESLIQTFRDPKSYFSLITFKKFPGLSWPYVFYKCIFLFITEWINNMFCLSVSWRFFWSYATLDTFKIFSQMFNVFQQKL